jgi:hypothetical protein
MVPEGMPSKVAPPDIILSHTAEGQAKGAEDKRCRQGCLTNFARRGILRLTTHHKEVAYVGLCNQVSCLSGWLLELL